jgi:hypothetical protein
MKYVSKNLLKSFIPDSIEISVTCLIAAAKAAVGGTMQTMSCSSSSSIPSHF